MATIGLLAPTLHRYERRVPLTPQAVRTLVDKNSLNVLVQRSPIRIFPSAEYRAAGAEVVSELGTRPDVYFNVKQIPIDMFHPGKTYVLFSHVHKGQSENMFMLKTMMDRRSTLIDYERIVDSTGNRVMAFSVFAGNAGITDTLNLLGKRLEIEGLNPNIFSPIRQTIDYKDGLKEIREQMQRIGDDIRRNGLPKEISPLIFGFTGNGRVTTGALQVFDALGPKEISPSDLLDQVGNLTNREIYKVIFRRSDRVKPADSGRKYSDDDFAASPGQYVSAMAPYLPHLTVLVNGIYWEPTQPRILNRAEMNTLLAMGSANRLRVIGDISCDVRGSIEATVKGTPVEEPYFVYHPDMDSAVNGWVGPGFAVNAVDTSPCELPREASRYFSKRLLPFVPAIANAEYAASYAEGILSLPSEVRPAVILWNGQITEAYARIEKMAESLAKYGKVPHDVNW